MTRGTRSKIKIEAVVPTEVNIAPSRLTPFNQRMHTRQWVMPSAMQSCVDIRDEYRSSSPLGPTDEGMVRPFKVLLAAHDEQFRTVGGRAWVVGTGTRELATPTYRTGRRPSGEHLNMSGVYPTRVRAVHVDTFS